MAYSTIAQVRAATGFSDDTKITDATITQYIADADSVINSKIADVYALPLTETPDIIAMISRHIVVGLLYANEYGEESQDTDKGWKGRMDWAMGILEDIRTQKTKLYDSNNAELARSNVRLATFKPTNDSSAATATDSDEPKLTMNQVF